MIVPPDKTLPAGQGEIHQTTSSAWIGICVKSEDCALGVPGPATDAPHLETDAHLPAPAEGARQQAQTYSDALVTCVKSEDCAQGVWSRGTCVKSEDCAQGDWSMASSAEDARLGTCVEPEKSKPKRHYRRKGAAGIDEREQPGYMITELLGHWWDVDASQHEDKTCVEPEKSKPKTRTMLTEAQARDIFRAKEFKTPATARLLAEQYDIRSNAVTDIWKSKTWKSHARQWQREIDEREQEQMEQPDT